MLERFLSRFRKKAEVKGKIDPQTGYPQEHMDVLNKMARGEMSPQIVLTTIDDEGLPKIELFDIPKKKQDNTTT